MAGKPGRSAGIRSGSASWARAELDATSVANASTASTRMLRKLGTHSDRERIPSSASSPVSGAPCTVPSCSCILIPMSWRAVAALSLLLVSCVSPQADDYGAAQGELTVCAHGTTVEGIDVSYYQGTINWSAVASSGIRFAIVRIGDGSYSDPRFAANWSGAASAGLIRGAYQYFEPQQDAMSQANDVVAAVGRLGPGDLPVTIDVEKPSPGVSPAVYASRIHTWVDRVTSGTGKPPIIYTGRYYWDPYVASSDFTDLPLWHAQYTSASCPNINDRWSDWAFWQYTSSGSVSGISGNVDRDRFNGSYAELMAFATSNQPPTGYLDAAGCDGIRGWAQDPDMPAASIDVHVYIGGAAGDPGAVGYPIHADQARSDLCASLGSCNHGFSMSPPLSLFDGADHPVYAYGIDAMGGANTLLTGAPMTLHCDTPPFPMPAEGAVRRVVSSAALSGWGWSAGDVATVSDTTLNAVPDGPDLTASPELVQASGDATIYLREYATLRPVPSPAVMTAWGFSSGAVSAVTASDLAADLTGANLLDAPFLAQGSSGTVYLIDAPPPLWATLASDDVPAQMQAGSTVDVTFTFQNRGSMTWTAGDVMLAPTPRDAASELCDPSWPSCARAAGVDADTAPGAMGTFHVRLGAPSQAGSLMACFGLVTGDHWFSDPGQNGPADDAICRTIEVLPAGVPLADAGNVPPSLSDGGVGTTPPPNSRHLTSGCACRAAPAAPAPMAPLALLSLLALMYRRRR